MATVSSLHSAKLQLYGPAWSRAFRNIWMLEELGVEYESIPKLPLSKAVRAWNPTGKVPVLVETIPDSSSSPFVLTESAAINNYLNDRYHGSLVPNANPQERAVYESVISCILTELDAPLWIHRKHDALGEHFGSIPEAVQHAHTQFDRVNEVLSQRLDPYIMGEQFTAADILYIHCLDWSKSIGWNVNWPLTIQPYRELCHQRPAYVAAKQLRDNNIDERRSQSQRERSSRL